ncbi:MAG: hemolysin III family protein [Ruminococcaceae bacterium]|nr:hemolysin III family protein [Oscillospiraceae bacterium]
MKNPKEEKGIFYTLGEEIFNSVSHGVGVLLSVAALTLLIVFAAWKSDGYGMASALVYGISLIILYSMSMVYHIVQSPKAKHVLRIFDHCSIFILIAGTYTPYLLMCMRNALGWTMFGLIWGMTVIGILLNAIGLERFSKVSLVCYVLMGWGIVFTIRPIAQQVGTQGTALLVAGGIVYTLGIIFYVLKKYRYMHSVWHLFVLGGSVCHYLSILCYVLPR